jgi:hypothetical protein
LEAAVLEVTMHRPRPLTPTIRLGLFALAMLAGTLCPGCQDQLFVPTEPRSQYDRFDAVRDRRAVDKVEDEFGNMRPNLRGRLLTSE